MKLTRALGAVLRELVALVVDDATTFVAVVVGLGATYAVAHGVGTGRHWAGFVLLGVVWAGLALSLTRANRR